MHIPGHLAVALAQHTLPPFRASKTALIILIAASLLPDVVDKTLGYVLKVFPSGRNAAHNIFALLGSTTLITALGNKAIGLAWFAGYSGHMLADFNSSIPWFYPLKQYPFKKKQFNFNWGRFFSEMFLLAIVGGLYWFFSRANLNSNCHGNNSRYNI
jgi:hypothetical protein